jgi:hypothetical protein
MQILNDHVARLMIRARRRERHVHSWRDNSRIVRRKWQSSKLVWKDAKSDGWTTWRSCNRIATMCTNDDSRRFNSSSRWRDLRVHPLAKLEGRLAANETSLIEKKLAVEDC